jgi:hypothetical protein
MENWESMYDNPKIIPTQTKGFLISKGNDNLNKNELNLEDLKFSMVPLMYLPLIDANHYYEISPYEAKKINRIQSRENTN